MSPTITYTSLTRRNSLARFSVACALLTAAALVALVTGGGDVSIEHLIRLDSWTGSTTVGVIITQIRLPRIVLAAAAGSSLAYAGALFQALLRNPLAEPYILGVSNGSAVGAILGIVLGLGPVGVPALSIAGAIAAVTAVLALGKGTYGRSAESMLLGGVMVGAMSAATIFLLLHMLGPQVRSAVQWMLGDLASASAAVGYGSGLILVALLVGAWWRGDAMNALAMGDDEAFALGFNVERLRVSTFLIASLVVGLTVSFCGAIGFVGLVVPHIVRRIVGPDHRILLPIVVAVGGAFTIACDMLARSILPVFDASAGELPIGAVTAIVGAPLFIALLRRS